MDKTFAGNPHSPHEATLVVGSDLAPTETSMTLWRQRSTSPANPDLHIGGPIDRGQIKTH